MKILSSTLLFILAGLCEIGGGYLVWLWLRNGRAFYLGAFGGFILFLFGSLTNDFVLWYGIIPTLQPFPNFGRIYAAYGGVFILLSLFWGWFIDGTRPDRFDIFGAAICLLGVTVILYAPRS